MTKPDRNVDATDTIAVFGLGYVGCVMAACLARLGHSVIGVDPDARKVCAVLEGRAPFYEPDLPDMVREAVASGCLTAAVSARQALTHARIAFICVGTPSTRSGDADLEQLRRVSGELGRELAGRPDAVTVAIRSTVLPGTCEDVVMPALAGTRAVVVANPEFEREGNAVRDFLEPSLVVVGGSDLHHVQQVADLYAPLGVAPCLVSLRAAEMIKYACNAFHAIKIDFANEIGTLCSSLSADGHEVMDALCRDTRLNTSRAYLQPGFAFGGSCLPKDLRALIHRARRLDLTLPLVESVLASNDRHLARAVDAVLDLPAQRIGIFGLAFKPNTDDVRESPVVGLLEQLIGKGRSVRVFDPHMQLEDIYGSNQRFLLRAIPHINRLLDSSLEQTLNWAEHVVVTQQPSHACADRIRQSGVPVLDLSSTWLPSVRAGQAVP